MSNIEHITAIYIPEGLPDILTSIQAYEVNYKDWKRKSQIAFYYKWSEVSQDSIVVGETSTRCELIEPSNGIPYLRSEANDTQKDNLLNLPHKNPAELVFEWDVQQILSGHRFNPEISSL